MFKKFSKDERIKAKYGLGLLFAAIAFISDLFFYVGYRHIPEQLYKPATFGAYILCFFFAVNCRGYYSEKACVREEY